MVASPRGDKKIVFRHEDLDGVNPYDPSDSFRSEDSLTRESLWESGLYGEWTETTNAVLEPKVFRGEEVITRAILKLQENPRQNELPISLAVTGKAVPQTSMRRKATPSSEDYWRTATLWFRTLTLVFRRVSRRTPNS